MAYLSEFLRFDSGEAEGGSSKNEQQVEGDPQLRRRRRTSRHSRALCHSLFLSFFTSSPASFMTWGWTQASAVFWLWFCFLQNSVSFFLIFHPSLLEFIYRPLYFSFILWSYLKLSHLSEPYVFYALIYLTILALILRFIYCIITIQNIYII